MDLGLIFLSFERDSNVFANKVFQPEKFNPVLLQFLFMFPLLPALSSVLRFTELFTAALADN